MPDQNLTLRVDAKGVDQVAAKVDKLAGAFDDVAKAAQNAGRAAGAINLDRIQRGLTRAGFNVDAARAAILNSDFIASGAGGRRYGNLADFFDSPRARMQEASAAGRRTRADVLRGLGLTAPPRPGAGFAGAGSIASGLGGMLLRGGIFGAGLMGFNGLASFVSRGFGQAYGEGISLNDAVRGSGALTSFNSLRAVTEKLGDEFHYLYTDTAKFATEWSRVTGGLGGIGSGLGGALGLARAFSIAPGTMTGLFGIAHRTGADHGDVRRFAIEFASALSRSGMPGMGAAMAQAMAAFADHTAALNVGRPDMLRYAGDLSGLMRVGRGALTPQAAAAILGSADATIRAGGGGGAFGQAWLMQTLAGVSGITNPFLLQGIEQSGLYGSAASTYGKGSALRALLQGSGVRFGRLSTTSNIDAIMRDFDARKGALGAGAAQFLASHLGLQDQAQAAALYETWKSNPGATNNMLARLKAMNISLSNIKTSGVGEMAAILGTKDWGTLGGYAQQFLNSGQLSASEKDALRKVLGGNNVTALQNALFGDAARHGQVENTATDLRDMKVSLANIETTLGKGIQGTLDSIAAYLKPVDWKGGAKWVWHQMENMPLPDEIGPDNWAPSTGKAALPQIPDTLDSYFGSFGSLGKLAKVVAFNESSFKQLRTNSKSSATGLFQFLRGTWKRYGAGGNPFSLDAQRQALLAEHADFVARGGKTPEQFLMFHDYGPGHMHDAPTPLVKREEAQLAAMGDLHVNVTVVTPSGHVLSSKTVPLPKPGTAYAPAGVSAPGP